MQPSDLESDALPLRHGVSLVRRVEVTIELPLRSGEQQTEESGDQRALYTDGTSRLLFVTLSLSANIVLAYNSQTGLSCQGKTEENIFYHWQYGLLPIK